MHSRKTRKLEESQRVIPNEEDYKEILETNQYQIIQHRYEWKQYY